MRDETEPRNETLSIKVSRQLKKDLNQLWDDDPRKFRKLSSFVAWLLGEVVEAKLTARQSAARQVGKQKAALERERLTVGARGRKGG